MAYPIILNSDHAEFEREHANTPAKERPDWPLPSFDAREWAEAFCKSHPGVAEDIMVSWFANALMRGFDEGRARSMEHSRYRRVEKLLGWAALALELGYKVAAGFVALVGAVLTMALVGWLIERVGMVVAGG